jgi:hypothetical protein
VVDRADLTRHDLVVQRTTTRKATSWAWAGSIEGLKRLGREMSTLVPPQPWASGQVPSDFEWVQTEAKIMESHGPVEWQGNFQEFIDPPLDYRSVTRLKMKVAVQNDAVITASFVREQTAWSRPCIEVEVSGGDTSWVLGAQRGIDATIRRDRPAWAWIRRPFASFVCFMLIFTAVAAAPFAHGITETSGDKSNLLAGWIAAIGVAVGVIVAVSIMSLIRGRTFVGFEITPEGADNRGTRALIFYLTAIGALVGVAALIVTLISI